MEKSIDRRWIAPDLRGHGRSPHQAPYGYAGYAADVAVLLQQHEEVDVVGHSMGGVVGMALATGWYGVKVRKVIAFGVKIRWAPDEAPKLHALARTPARLFDTKEQAVERYLKVSGLFGLVDAGSPMAQSGVREEDGRWRLAADPMINAAAGPELAPLVRAMQCPLRLAAGSKDPMVNAADMAPHDPRARSSTARATTRRWSDRASCGSGSGPSSHETPAEAVARRHSLARRLPAVPAGRGCDAHAARRLAHLQEPAQSANDGAVAHDGDPRQP
jgi:pimeloyl-ACP methyl ester carboxylesterase